MPPTTRRWVTVGIGVLVAVRVLSALVALAVTDADASNPLGGGDVRRYEQIAGIEGTPWRDGAVEYPPLSVALVEAVTVGDTARTEGLLVATQLACDLAAAAALGWGFGRRGALAYLLVGLPFALYPFVYWRIDLLSVALAAAGLALLARRRDAAGGAVLALGALAKLWPAVLGGWMLVERRWRALAAAVGVGTVGVVTWLGVAGPDGITQVVSFRGATGWQVESLPGIVHHVLAPESFRAEAGALRTGVAPDWARLVLPLLAMATVAAAWLAAARRLDPTDRDPDGDTSGRHAVVGAAGTASVTALLVFAPIFSPQYAAWLLPPVAVAVAGGDRLLGWLAGGVVAASTLGYVLIGGQGTSDVASLGAILVRNALAVALLAVAMARLAPTGASHAPPLRTGR